MEIVYDEPSSIEALCSERLKLCHVEKRIMQRDLDFPTLSIHSLCVSFISRVIEDI